jgi:hypothetical protein
MFCVPLFEHPGFTVLLQSLEGVLPHRLQEPVARLPSRPSNTTSDLSTSEESRSNRYAEGLSAGRKNRQVRAAPQQERYHYSARLHQVLAIVQHQEHLFGTHIIRERLGERAAGFFPHQDRGEGLRHDLGVREWGQLHQPHPFPEATRQLRRHGQG